MSPLTVVMYLADEYERMKSAGAIPVFWVAVQDKHGVIFTGPAYDLAILTHIEQGNA
jgi:hypothetical protein